MSSLLVHALSLLTILFSHFTFYSLIFFLFVYLLCFLCFLFLCFSMFPVVPPCFCLLCTAEAFFILPAVMRFTILPLNHFWPVVGVLPRLPIGLLATQPPPLPFAGRVTLHSQKKVVLFCFLASRGIPIRIRVGLLSY